jgi:uncharacterized membrane protein
MDRLKNWLNKATDFEKLRVLVVVLFLVAFGWNMAQYVFLPGNLPKDYTLDLAGQNLVVFSKYDRGVVEEVALQQLSSVTYGSQQQLKVQLLTGDQKGKSIAVEHQAREGDRNMQIAAGDKVVLGYYEIPGESNYVVIDRYRLPSLAWLGVFFGLLVLLVARWRGFSSLVAMLFSLGVLYFGIAPNILVGHNPVLVTIAGSILVLVVSIFLSHGFKRKTALAFFATVLTMLLSIAMSEIAVVVAKVFGSGNSDALFLQSGLAGTLNLQGLLLAGIIIGTLGILDDVTTTQVSIVKELNEVNPTLSTAQLFTRAMQVGKDHIAAIVNTLIFAYAGVAMPLFLLVLVNVSQPIWVMINSEPIAEEIVRMIVGSCTLVVAVPLASFIAAAWYGKKKEDIGQAEDVVVVEETVVVVEE